MGNLALLPTEILDQITNNVSRDDIESYALTCRRLFENSENELRKHRSRKPYIETEMEVWASVVVNSKVTLRQWWESHPFWLLRALLDDPGLCPYVAHLRVIYDKIPGTEVSLRHLVDGEDFAGLPIVADTRDERDKLERAGAEGLQMRLLPYGSRIRKTLRDNQMYFQGADNDNADVSDDRPHSMQAWYAKIMYGSRPMIFGLILLLLRDIQTLTIINCYTLTYELDDLLKGITDNTAVPNEDKPLSKVTTIDIGTPKAECAWSHSPSADTLKAFVKLPSVQKAKGLNLDFSWLREPQQEIYHETVIESIQLLECDTYASMYWIFGRPSALKMFHFTSGFGTENNFDAYMLTDWLRHHASPTLEELTLVHRPKNPPNSRHRGSQLLPPAKQYVGSLQTFERLTCARLMVNAFSHMPPLVDYDDGLGPMVPAPHRLVDVLPFPIERLTLCDERPARLNNGPARNGMEFAEVAGQLLRGMEELKQSRLPMLKHIVFETDPQIDSDTLQRFRKLGLYVLIEEQETLCDSCLDYLPPV
ncbi:MAG: hypothetical protein LQ345_002615 [Seirophora villosa]|nr:MAG: hypothetical protein LQ345_002615 [Seirophora villosa]